MSSDIPIEVKTVRRTMRLGVTLELSVFDRGKAGVSAVVTVGPDGKYAAVIDAFELRDLLVRELGARA